MLSRKIGVLLPTLMLVACACGGPGLKLAKLESSTQRPSNIAIYFTVDTADGEPVPGLEAESFRIYEDDRLVSVLESKQTILNPEVAAEHFTLLLVDMSGSVVESGDLPAVVDGASSFADRIRAQQKVAIYAFDGRAAPSKIVPFTNSPDRIRSGIASLSDYKTRDPSTNLNGAVVSALRILDSQLRRSSAPLRFATLVIFTDGSDRAARVTREELDDALANSQHEVITIGVGAEIEPEELEAIGRSGVIIRGGREDISAAFAEAADRVDAYTARYYLLGYCSPARAGVHKVRIEATSEGASGSLEHEFNARGFGPGCDPTKKPRFNTKRPRDLR